MNQNYFIGVDISKGKVDVAVINKQNQIVSEKIIGNDRSKLANYFNGLIRKLKVNADQVLICCENTGNYTRPLQLFSAEHGFSLWVENAYKIKKAASDLRGKSDKKDALRIAQYALRYCDQQLLYKEPSQGQNRLAHLLHARESLIGQINQLNQQLTESKKFDPVKYDTLKTCYDKPIKELKRQVKKAEAQIKEQVAANESLSTNVGLLKSVPGIGQQNALNFMVYTQNFTLFESADHLACYVGVVPFPNQSGTMIKRDRVSPFANKKLKKLLHLAAMAAVKAPGELKEYYIRKVKEGKNKMSVLNAVRNKLVKRMFAVIQRQSPYMPMINQEVSINSETSCRLT